MLQNDISHPCCENALSILDAHLRISPIKYRREGGTYLSKPKPNEVQFLLQFHSPLPSQPLTINQIGTSTLVIDPSAQVSIYHQWRLYGVHLLSTEDYSLLDWGNAFFLLDSFFDTRYLRISQLVILRGREK